MANIAYFLHYAGIVSCMFLGCCGVAIGQGIGGSGGIIGLNRQELAVAPIRRAMLVGLALLETGCVFCLVIAAQFLFYMPFEPTLATGFAVLGSGLGLGIAACIVGITSGRVVSAALQAIARQPFHASKVMSLMMLTQILLEAPAVFSFVIGFIVRGVMTPEMSLARGIACGVAGLVLGLCSIGPAMGQSIFASAASTAIGRNPDMFSRVLSFSFVVQALIETPIIFGLLLSLSMIMLLNFEKGVFAESISVLIGSLCAFGFGSLGAGIGCGRVGGKAVTCMIDDPEQYTMLFRTAVISQAVIDTALIYSLVISFFLLREYL